MTNIASILDWKTRLGIVAAAILATTMICLTFQDRDAHNKATSSSTKSNRNRLSEDVIQLSLARRAAERGDSETALQHVDQVTQIQPDSIPANLMKAELLFRLFRTDEMRPALENILRQDPEHFEAHANMAFALQYSGELDEAKKHVDWCLLRRHDFLPVLRMRAEILRDQGDSVRALAEVRSILEIYSHDIATHLLEAEILVYQRDFEAAYLSLQPLSEASHQSPRLAALMAQICQLLGKEAEAIQFRAVLDKQKQEKPNQ